MVRHKKKPTKNYGTLKLATVSDQQEDDSIHMHHGTGSSGLMVLGKSTYTPQASGSLCSGFRSSTDVKPQNPKNPNKKGHSARSTSSSSTSSPEVLPERCGKSNTKERNIAKQERARPLPRGKRAYPTLTRSFASVAYLGVGGNQCTEASRNEPAAGFTEQKFRLYLHSKVVLIKHSPTDARETHKKHSLSSHQTRLLRNSIV